MDEIVNVFDDNYKPPSDEEQVSARLTEVALEVLDGKWGEGQDRRTKLAEAGLDPVEVQREVVRVLNKQT